MHAAIHRANDEKSGVFKFGELQAKVKSKQATVFFNMKGGPSLTRDQLHAYQQQDLIELFTPERLTVDFHMEALENKSDSPVGDDDF